MSDSTRVKPKAYNLSEDLGIELEKEAEERRKKRKADKLKNAVLSADSLSRGGDTLKVPK